MSENRLLSDGRGFEEEERKGNGVHLYILYQPLLTAADSYCRSWCVCVCVFLGDHATWCWRVSYDKRFSPWFGCFYLFIFTVIVRWEEVKETPVKGPWSSEEDDHLKRLVEVYGAKKW